MKPVYLALVRYKERNELHLSIKDGRTGHAIEYPLVGHREVERLLHPSVVRLMSKARAYAPEERRVGTFFVSEVDDEVSLWRPVDEPALKETLARLWGDTVRPAIGQLSDVNDPLKAQREESERLDDLPDL